MRIPVLLLQLLLPDSGFCWQDLLIFVASGLVSLSTWTLRAAQVICNSFQDICNQFTMPKDDQGWKCKHAGNP